MPNASQVNIDEVDQTYQPPDVPVSISACLGYFKRGPINNPNTIITGFNQFQKIFGGLVAGVDDGIMVQRALARGSQLRVVNLRHYTNPTDPTTLTATLSTPATGKSVSLNVSLITGNTLAVTINGTVISQLYTTSSDNTFALLVQLIQQSVPLLGVVSSVIYLGSNVLLITPQTGVVLVVTATITGGASQATATIASVNTFATSTGTAAFSLTPQNPGQDYNNLQVSIQAASNGNASYFNLIIAHLLEPNLNETYQNLLIVGNPSVANSSYLQAITNGSQLMNVTYNDLSGTSGQQRPINIIIKYDTGTDGGALVDADLIGASGTKIGVYALDPYADFISFASFNSNSVGVISALSAYAANRQDCRFFAHIDNSYVTEAQVAAFRDSTLVDSSYTGFFAGGVQIVDPFTSLTRGISEIGDVIGIAAYSAAQFGLWYSFAGPRRGIITNALGVVNNFGLDSNYAGRNLLANHQVCLAINKDGSLQISGNFTAQLASSTLSFMNVRGMLLYLKRELAPIYNSYVEEPNDPTTWLAIYNEVKPVLTALQSNRAIVAGSNGWSYQGDQFVTDPSQCVINDPDDVQDGMYTVNLYIKDIVSLQIIQVNIILTDSGVSFEDTLSTIGSSSNQ